MNYVCKAPHEIKTKQHFSKKIRKLFLLNDEYDVCLKFREILCSNKYNSSSFTQKYYLYRFISLYGNYKSAADIRKDIFCKEYNFSVIDKYLHGLDRRFDVESFIWRFHTNKIKSKKLAELEDRPRIKSKKGLLAQTNVAILGPACSNLGEVKGGMLRCVPNPSEQEFIACEYQLRDVVAFFNREAFNLRLKNSKEFLKKFPIIFVRTREDLRIAKRHKLGNVSLMSDGRSWLIHDYGFNAVPNILYTCIEQGCKHIHVAGVSLFLGNNLARKSYKEPGFNEDTRIFGMRLHDPIVNFIFLKYFFEAEFFQADEILSEILNMDVSGFASNFDNQWNSKL